ncbi:MAG: serine/threonine protein kinase [Streptosporangiaceae bacterium]
MGDDTRPARADVKAGDKVAGYQLEEQIGQGGMAVVYRAHDERLDRRVALKVLSPALAADTAFRTRFIRESRAAAAVDHPNIIPVYDAGDAGGCLFISMRYVQGGDVRSLIADSKPLPPARAWNIISQVASALDAAHGRDLVHRDVKPANMLLDRRQVTEPDPETTGPTKEHVYLSDFGISKQTIASNLTSTGQFVGTLDYIAPEQIEGKGLDGRADQYSLACAAYELLSGAPPFSTTNGFALINSHLSEQARPITTLRQELPQAADRVLAKAMSKTAAERYASCDQFATDLGRALGVLPGSPDAGGQPPAGQPSSHPMTELAQAGTGQLAAAAAADAAAAAAAPGQLATNKQALPDPDTMLAGQPGTGQPGTSQQGTGQPGTAGQPLGGYPGQQGNTGQPWGGYPGQQPGYGQYPPPYQTYPTPGGPGGPTGPGWPQYPPPQQPKRSHGLLIGTVVGAVAILIAAGAVAYAAFHNGTNGTNGTSGDRGTSSSPPATSTSPVTPAVTAKSEATSVNSILTAMIGTRNLLLSGNGLVNDVGSCTNIDGAVQEARRIYSQRSRQDAQATSVDAGLISNGAALKSELIKAVNYSLTFDHDLLLWAKQQKTTGCTVGTGSVYYPPLESTSTLNQDATSAKQLFLSNWNSVAPQYQLPTYSVADPPI